MNSLVKPFPAGGWGVQSALQCGGVGVHSALQCGGVGVHSALQCGGVGVNSVPIANEEFPCHAVYSYICGTVEHNPRLLGRWFMDGTCVGTQMALDGVSIGLKSAFIGVNYRRELPSRRDRSRPVVQQGLLWRKSGLKWRKSGLKWRESGLKWHDLALRENHHEPFAVLVALCDAVREVVDKPDVVVMIDGDSVRPVIGLISG